MCTPFSWVAWPPPQPKARDGRVAEKVCFGIKQAKRKGATGSQMFPKPRHKLWDLCYFHLPSPCPTQGLVQVRPMEGPPKDF